MLKKAKRYFNTSGPNIPEEHYTLQRVELISEGIDLVQKERYFTIWAPRQTGKSTYFLMLAKKLQSLDYQVIHTNLENFMNVTEESFLEILGNEFKRTLNITVKTKTFPHFFDFWQNINDQKIVLIIDEIEGLNESVFGQFLHTIRNLYHSRKKHSLKSVIFVGVSNIVGVIQDNASPFNIADNLEVPYFTSDETRELLHMHELETLQKFDSKVIAKISDMTANQPGLVNGFAYQLVSRFPEVELINYDHYLEVEDWYLTESIDKNISNIINKASKYREFIEKLLFTEERPKFRINDQKIKFLHSHGLLKKDKEGFIEFWVPMYKKALIDAFSPTSNGESNLFFRNIDLSTLLNENGEIRFDELVNNYKDYVKRRSFKYFREKDDQGNYKNLKEAAVAYSFETYIQTLVGILKGKSYLEPHSGLGRSDLIVNIEGYEYVVEFKIFRETYQFERGKKQLAYYCKSIGVKQGIYLVFVPNTVTLPQLKEQIEKIDEVKINTYIVFYDEEKDF